MNHSLTSKIVLFTLSACPMGRSMGTVLREVAAIFPELSFETVYVEIEVEKANRYRIKTNPTTLFLNEHEKELYRLEGFHETNIVQDVIEKINQGSMELSLELEENTETIEEYTLYLLRDGKMLPVQVTNHNRTSIKAPRITAITLLVQAAVDGYDNPFPPGTTLKLVQFHNTTGIITLELPTKAVDHVRLSKMKEALEKTLFVYGIGKVELILENHSRNE